MENTKSMSLAARKEHAAAEGRSALAEVRARDSAVRKNMARLRELRIAKELAEREAEAARGPVAAPPPKAKPKKKKAAPPAKVETPTA